MKSLQISQTHAYKTTSATELQERTILPLKNKRPQTPDEGIDTSAKECTCGQGIDGECLCGCGPCLDRMNTCGRESEDALEMRSETSSVANDAQTTNAPSSQAIEPSLLDAPVHVSDPLMQVCSVCAVRI